MKIGVFLKQVPDTETRMVLRPDGSGIDMSNVKWVINPYDEFAVEEALKLKEKFAGSEVVIVTLGPVRSADAMRQAFAMGADRGIRIDGTGAHLDTRLVGLALSKVAQEEKFDIIFGGKKSVDDECSATLQYIAEAMGIPVVLPISTFEMSPDGKSAKVERALLGGVREVIEVDLPCIIGCEKGLNTPRYASLPGIMKAKTKPILEKKATDLVGAEKESVTIRSWAIPPARAKGRTLEGTPEALADEVVKYINNL